MHIYTHVREPAHTQEHTHTKMNTRRHNLTRREGRISELGVGPIVFSKPRANVRVHQKLGYRQKRWAYNIVQMHDGNDLKFHKRLK